MNNCQISGRTKICGIIGNPIEHTLSPRMHNAAFQALGLDYVYLAFRVEATALRNAIEGLRAINLSGVNVTKPHKVEIIPLLDEMAPLAQKIGAVNTVVNTKGVLRGYNTDAGGFLRALIARDVVPEGKKVVILGAGGAARAIAFALAERGASLVIVNKTIDHAQACAAKIREHFGTAAQALALNRANLETALRDANIIVNATSLGMSPNINETPMPGELIHPGMVVFDIVYNPVETRFLSEARRAGATIIDGLDMLVEQGALAFELWTGIKAPTKIMKQALLEVSGKK
jgi:shikimate dehydrogenase